MDNQIPGRGMSGAALVLGIISCALAWLLNLPIVALGQIISLIIGIIGLILALISKKKAKDADINNGLATAGVILSAVGIVFSLFSLIICGIVFSGETYAGMQSGEYDLKELESMLETVIETY